jgi:hypothetical protein
MIKNQILFLAHSTSTLVINADVSHMQKPDSSLWITLLASALLHEIILEITRLRIPISGFEPALFATPLEICRDMLLDFSFLFSIQWYTPPPLKQKWCTPTHILIFLPLLHSGPGSLNPVCH